MFGPVALEAVVTGIGAAVLSYMIGTAIRALRKTPVAE
jgi:VIT1/CCC1 family predicted Fe2+/Mn2+ transporter